MTRRYLTALLLALVLVALVVSGLTSTEVAQGTMSAKLYLPQLRNDRPTSTPTFTPTSTPTSTPTPSPTPPTSTSPYHRGKPGYDLSFPQCGGLSLPSTASNGAAYTFAVVGTTGGKAFTQNNCVGTEAAAAAGQGVLVSYYMNINAPIGSSASNGNTGPRGTCAPGDNICLSYNYGYNAAQYAYNWAIGQVGANGVVGHVWWLDVETANSWFGDTNANDQAIQGAIDYLQQHGSSVGVYSIPSMWNYASIAGPAADGSQPIASLELWPLIAGSGFRPGVPSWTSGASSLSSASSMCSSGTFTGGGTWLVQVPNYTAPNGANYDEDYAC